MQGLLEAKTAIENVSMVPKGFRDLLAVFAGAGFIMVASFTQFRSLLLGAFNNLNALSPLERDTIIIVVAFFMGRFLDIVGDVIYMLCNSFLHFIIWVLNPTERKNRFSKFKEQVGAYFKYPVARKGYSKDEMKKIITNAEISSYIEKNKGLASEMERLLYHKIFTKLTLVISLFAGLFISPFYLIAFVVLFIRFNDIRATENSRYDDVFATLVKYSSAKD